MESAEGEAPPARRFPLHAPACLPLCVRSCKADTKLHKNRKAVANVEFRARKKFCTSEGGLPTERGSLFAGRVSTFAPVCLLFTDFVFLV